MEEHQIEDSRFEFYADQFALAATAGIRRSNALHKAISPAFLVDLTTLTDFERAQNAKNGLIRILQTSYAIILREAQALDPMRDAFLGLASHIRLFTGDTLDKYLTTEGILVDATYANINNLTENPISDSNVR